MHYAEVVLVVLFLERMTVGDVGHDHNKILPVACLHRYCICSNFLFDVQLMIPRFGDSFKDFETDHRDFCL